MPSRTLPETDDAKPVISKPLLAFSRLSRKVGLYTPPTTNGLSSRSNNHPPLLLDKRSTQAHRLLCQDLHVPLSLRAHHPQHHNHARIPLPIRVPAPGRRQRSRQRDPSPQSSEQKTLCPGPQQRRCQRIPRNRGLDQALTGKALRDKAFLLDSAPGIPKFRRYVHALTVPVMKWPLWKWIPYLAVTLAVVSVVFVRSMGCRRGFGWI